MITWLHPLPWELHDIENLSQLGIQTNSVLNEIVVCNQSICCWRPYWRFTTCDTQLSVNYTYDGGSTTVGSGTTKLSPSKLAASRCPLTSVPSDFVQSLVVLPSLLPHSPLTLPEYRVRGIDTERRERPSNATFTPNEAWKSTLEPLNCMVYVRPTYGG